MCHNIPVLVSDNFSISEWGGGNKRFSCGVPIIAAGDIGDSPSRLLLQFIKRELVLEWRANG